jgi:Flp pilus assembly protein TadG
MFESPEEEFMRHIKNERGSVLVFITLMMVLLFVMVGLGLDTGHLAYIRSQGQPAVDAAALSAVNAIPTLQVSEVYKRAAALNYNGAMGNNYLNSPNNLIDPNTGKNVTLVKYNGATGSIDLAASIAEANGVRVALENKNPYDPNKTPTPMKSPLFLTPLFNLMGQKTSGTQNVSVSAVAVLSAIPGFPVAVAGCSPPPATAQCEMDGNGNYVGNGTYATPYKNCRLLQTNSSNNSNNGTLAYQDSGWTTFTVPSANAPAIKALVRNNQNCGNIPPITVGSCIYLNNGQIKPVLSEFDDVYSNNTYEPDPTVPAGLSGTGATPHINDWGVIPVVNRNISNFNQCQMVEGWAKFGIRHVEITGNDKYLVGDLICGWSLDKVGGTGCYTTRLVRDTKSGM